MLRQKRSIDSLCSYVRNPESPRPNIVDKGYPYAQAFLTRKNREVVWLGMWLVTGRNTWREFSVFIVGPILPKLKPLRHTWAKSTRQDDDRGNFRIHVQVISDFIYQYFVLHSGVRRLWLMRVPPALWHIGTAQNNVIYAVHRNEFRIMLSIHKAA